jgi:hypothetical protein
VRTLLEPRSGVEDRKGISYGSENFHGAEDIEKLKSREDDLSIVSTWRF